MNWVKFALNNQAKHTGYYYEAEAKLRRKMNYMTSCYHKLVTEPQDTMLHCRYTSFEINYEQVLSPTYQSLSG